MTLEYAILGFLSEHPRSGYDLKTRCFNDDGMPFWSADQAQIYRTLERLRTDKLVTARRKRQSGRPDRKIFEITPAGGDALSEWAAHSAPLPPVRDTLALQLFFGAAASDDALADLLADRRDQHQARLERLRALSVRLAKDHTRSARSAVLRQTAVDGAIARERTSIDWLDDCIDAIRDGALPGSTSKEIGQRHLFGT